MAIRSDITEDAQWFTDTDHEFEFTVKKPDGTARDITGYALSWRVKRNRADPDSKTLIYKTVNVGGGPGGITITNGPNGICVVSVTAAVDTATLRAGILKHELKVVDSKSVLSFGDATLQQSAHQD